MYKASAAFSVHPLAVFPLPNPRTFALSFNMYIGIGIRVYTYKKRQGDDEFCRSV